MFKYSFIYRLLSNSWFLNWTVSVPSEEKRNYISNSGVYRFSNTVMDFILNILYRTGDTLRKLGEGSIISRNFLGFLGIIIFFWFTYDLIINDYGMKRTFIEIFWGLFGIYLFLHKYVRGLWQSSLILSFFRWWARTD